MKIRRLFSTAIACAWLAGSLLGPDALAATKSTLPIGSDWRTFAKPLPLGTDEMLFFQRDGGNAVGWRVNWKTKQTLMFKLGDLQLASDARFSAVSNQEGLWLIGQRTVLLRPNGQSMRLDSGFNEPVVVALDDGSIAVFGKSLGGNGGGIVQLKVNAAAGRIDRVERGPLSFSGQVNEKGKTYREPGYGHVVVKLKDGRILMMGGSNTATLASIVTPRLQAGAWAVTPVAPLPHPRVGAAAVVLADGRVVVTGAPHLNCYFDAAAVRGADIYDPTSNRWTALPLLPFTPCADSYGANAPAVTTTPGGALVVGGHLEPHIMVLQRDAASPTGFAANWTVHGQFPQTRTGGIVQAISETDMVVAGGVHRSEQVSPGCCYATSGFDSVAIGATEDAGSRALRYVGAGAALRGTRVFAASGRRFGSTGFGQLRYSSHAELIDLVSGKVRQLPTVPIISGGAQVLWLDDERVLLKGIEAKNDRGFARNENLASSVPESSGAMGIFNLKRNAWTDVIALPALAASTLLEAHGNEARLLSEDGAVQFVNLSTRRIDIEAQLLPPRLGGTARLVLKNRLVAAGGTAQNIMVSEFDEGCSAQGQPDCVERYVGFGPFAPATNMQSLTIGRDSPGGMNDHSHHVAANAKTSAIAIARDGTVYLLASDAQNETHRLVRSISDSKRWQAMPPPAGVPICKDDCALMVAPDPRDANKELLFWRHGSIDAMWNDDEIAGQYVKVWLWNADQRVWQKVLSTDGMSARTTPMALSTEALGSGTRKMMSMGWHLETPILWLTPVTAK